MRKLLRQRPVDRMLDAYVDWRDACGLVTLTYRSWAGSTGPGAGAAFFRHSAALDQEERAAEVYAGRVGRSGASSRLIARR
jgi:hypothetical protein